VVVFPGEIDAQKISAKYEDGIIKCVVGKVIEETPTTIKIDIE
jgi:HSP20 family molecular chaperone IbpA